MLEDKFCLGHDNMKLTGIGEIFCLHAWSGLGAKCFRAVLRTLWLGLGAKGCRAVLRKLWFRLGAKGLRQWCGLRVCGQCCILYGLGLAQTAFGQCCPLCCFGRWFCESLGGMQRGAVDMRFGQESDVLMCGSKSVCVCIDSDFADLC